jgi:hypothetical protein
MTEEVKSESAKKNEDWMNSKWRPAMGWMYMLVCVADFVIFPILWSLVQVIAGGEVKTQWSPITLQGAGLFHMAMGAILGIAAYGRTQEKLNDKAGATLPPATSAPSFGAPAVSGPAPSFGSTSLGNNTVSTAPAFKSASAFGAPTTTSSSGKAMPVQPDQPEI